MIKEFRDFIMRGNVLDLAVAVIIAGAFGKIVGSFTEDILMPPIGMILGNMDFTDLKIVLQAASGDIPEVAIRWGQLVTYIIDFLIIAFVLFMIIKAYNRLNAKPEPAPAPPAGPTEKDLLTEIRDLLKKG
ncbi:MAG TPA: large-conductance mechanosensitive channel protein MscL [Saprospiraceae bacterium]|nr:large-conductance mechanosensitive channel protein MscL [Saprospiraceae bacterium]